METTNNKKLTVLQMYSYSLGEFGFTFFLMFVGYYLMYFLTDVLALPAFMAAFLYTLVQWFETITVVISGAFMDRVLVKKGKYGKYRPWLILGGSACFIGTILFFTKFNVPTAWYWILFPLFYLIAYWGYNFQWVAYRALNGIISKTPEERTSVTIKSSQMSSLSALTFSFIAVKILYGFGSIETGYTVSAALYTGIMLICLFIVARVAKPYDVDLSNNVSAQKNKVGFFESLKCLEGQMLLYFVSSVLRNAVISIVNALMVYHFTLRLKRADLMSWYISTTTIGQLIGVTLAEPVVKKFGKKPSYIVSSIASSCILLAAYFLSMNPYAFIACMTLNNFASIFGGSLIPAFLNDIAEYNEVERHLDTRSLTISLGAAAIRVASLIGGAIASFGLAAIGYSKTAETIADTTLVAITKLCTLLPSALMLLCIIPMFWYKLDDKTMIAIAAKKDAMIASGEAEEATLVAEDVID